MVSGFKLWKRTAIIITLSGAFSTAYVRDTNSAQRSKIIHAFLALCCAANMGNIEAN